MTYAEILELMDQTGSAANGILGLAKSIFGKSEQKKQKELFDYTSQKNFEYQERSADNAMRRQMQLYEQSHQDQSAEARVHQLQDANLSVGLMYGGGGVSGVGGAGSTSGAPQAEPHPGTTGTVSTDAEKLQAAIAQQQLGLQQQKNKAEIEYLEARKTEAMASAKAHEADAADKDKTRESRIWKITEEARKTWIENNRNLVIDENKFDPENPEWNQGAYEYTETIAGKEIKHVINSGNFWDTQNQKLILETLADIDETIASKELKQTQKTTEGKLSEYYEEKAKTETSVRVRNYAEAKQALANELLTNTKARYYFFEMLADIAQKNSTTALNRARSTASALQHGEEKNWKTVVDYGFKALTVLSFLIPGGGIAKGVSKLPAAFKWIKGLMKFSAATQMIDDSEEKSYHEWLKQLENEFPAR